MTRGLTLIVAALVALAPFGVSAQTTPPPAEQKAGTAAGAAAAPAAPATKPAEKKPAVTFTPYGFVQVTADLNNGNFDNGGGDVQYPGIVVPQTTTATRSFLIHARNSRFGLRIGLPEALGAKLGATFEVDFRGGFGGATNVSFYQPLLRLRLAYGTATWAITPGYNIVLLAGQDYGLVTPLFATSAAYTGDPIFWKAGNTWHRTPQLRLSGESTGQFGLIWQAAVLSPLDNASGAETLFVGPGNRSRRPDVEGRVAVNMKSGKTKLFEVGVAGHVGWERYSTSASVEPTEDLRSEMVGVDAQVNTKFLALKGEAWQGSNIEDYFTVNNGVVGNATPGVRSLRSRGIWGQAVVQPLGTALLQVVGGAGVEEPEVDDIVLAAAPTRTMNRMLSGGVIVNPSANWRAGVEMTKTLTQYRSTTATTELQGIQTAITTSFIF
jgi:hypothetical protein